jgi:hypothetical protein
MLYNAEIGNSTMTVMKSTNNKAVIFNSASGAALKLQCSNSYALHNVLCNHASYAVLHKSYTYSLLCTLAICCLLCLPLLLYYQLQILSHYHHASIPVHNGLLGVSCNCLRYLTALHYDTKLSLRRTSATWSGLQSLLMQLVTGSNS